MDSHVSKLVLLRVAAATIVVLNSMTDTAFTSSFIAFLDGCNYRDNVRMMCSLAFLLLGTHSISFLGSIDVSTIDIEVLYQRIMR